MSVVYVVQGVHFSVPGQVLIVCGTIESAKREAADLVNVLRADLSLPPSATADNWEAVLAATRAVQAGNIGVQLDDLADSDDDGDVWITVAELHT